MGIYDGMRYFRSSTAVYEQARFALDAAWGLPNDTGTVTCIEPAATAPRDAQGRIVLAVDDEFCAYSVAVDLLPQTRCNGLPLTGGGQPRVTLHPQ